jgi:hypothetical protein
MRNVSAIALLGLALVFATTAVADGSSSAQVFKAKKCFKKKHGKRVRVKCKKKATQPQTPSSTTPPAPAPSPPPDPAFAKQAIGAVSGQMLHHFSTSPGAGAFQGDEILHLCSDGRYKYLAQFYMEPGGLLGTITDEAGTWHITGAQPGANNATDAGLFLLPGDGTAPHFVVVSLIPTIDGWEPFIAGSRWYLGPSTLCT